MSDSKRRMGGRGIWIGVAVVAALVVALAVFGMVRKHGKGNDAGSGDQKERVLDVSVAEVVPATAQDIIEIPGYLEPFADATISAEKGGRIVEMLVEKGDRVAAGQPLVRLDDRIWKAHAAQARVQAHETEQEWIRWQKLQNSGAVSSSDLDAVRKARDLAAAALVAAEVQVEQCVVVSPMDGVVADRYMEPGEFVAEGGALVRLVDVDRLKLILDVAERDVVAVEPGREVAFRVNGFDQRFSGVVRFVSPAAARRSNAFRTEVEVDNRRGLLKAGMIAAAELVRRERQDAIVIPLDAVVNDEGQHVVFVVENGRAVRRIVYIDAIQAQRVVLRKGLEAGERLVTAGQRSLQDGRAVKVVNL